MIIKKILIASAFILAFYLVLTLYINRSANSLIFQAPKHASYTQDEEVTTFYSGKTAISAYYFQNPNAEKTIIYSHGNAEDIGMIKLWTQEMSNWGYNVLSYDYQGYGTSTGKPSEKNTYKDITLAYQMATTKGIAPENIIVYGRSLGTGPSVYLAANYPVGAVILQSPFTSAYDVVTKLPIFVYEKYDNLAKINDVSAPILFIHGKEDKVIPFELGKKLFEAYNGPKESLWLDAGHNDIELYHEEEIKEAIVDFIN